MAVGMILRCDVCGKSYDNGKGPHGAYCDGGEELRTDEADLERFNALDRDDALEEVYIRLRRLERAFSGIPYDGPIG